MSAGLLIMSTEGALYLVPLVAVYCLARSSSLHRQYLDLRHIAGYDPHMSKDEVTRAPRFPIPQGTLDMLILQIVSLEPAHGYGIAQRLQQISRYAVRVNQGSL